MDPVADRLRRARRREASRRTAPRPSIRERVRLAQPARQEPVQELGRELLDAVLDVALVRHRLGLRRDPHRRVVREGRGAEVSTSEQWVTPRSVRNRSIDVSSSARRPPGRVVGAEGRREISTSFGWTTGRSGTIELQLSAAGVNGGGKPGHLAAEKPASSAQFFDLRIASLFGLGGPLLRPGLRSGSRRAQRRSRRPEGPRVAARSVLDGREHDGTLAAGGRARSRRR